jgi:hypothetical protein
VWLQVARVYTFRGRRAREYTEHDRKNTFRLGQVDPSSNVGDNRVWKNAKKITRRIRFPVQ